MGKPARACARCGRRGVRRTLADLDPQSVALVGGLQLSDRSPEQDDEPSVPERGRKMIGTGALPLAEIVNRVVRAHPSLPVGAELLSDEVDALGLEDGTRRIAGTLRSLLETVASKSA